MQKIWFSTTVCLLLIDMTVSQRGFSRPARFRTARQEDEAPSNGAVGGDDGYNYGPPPPQEQTESPESGPYPPSGWKPSGQLLLVPGETHSSQNNYNSYGAPPTADKYGAPQSQQTTQNPNKYGPPRSTTQPDNISTTILPETEEGNNETDQAENGQYYVLLPDGKLQRVKYTGKQNAGKYTAKVQYEVVDPVRSPVYAYQGVSLP